MTINAQYFNHGVHSEAPVLAGATAGIPYPGSVLTNTGVHLYNGVSYDMAQEGLYRFFNESNGTCFNKIALVGFVGNADVYKFLSAIAENHVHGTKDNHTYYQGVSNDGRYRMWESQCGYISGFCHWILPQCGFTTRVVNVKTLETLNGWNDGHVVLEVYIDGAWRMFDMTNGVYFTDENDNHMSAQQFITQIAGGGDFPTTVKMDASDKSNAAYVNGVSLQVWERLYFVTDAQKEVWYRRIFQSIA